MRARLCNASKSLACAPQRARVSLLSAPHSCIARAKQAFQTPSCRAVTKLEFPDPKYRLNAGICLYQDGLVWVGRRTKADGDRPRWQMPQGGIDAGENPSTAAHRELEEETGVHSVTLVSETDGWLHYTFPEAGRADLPRSLRAYQGQAQKWFLMRFEGSEDEIRLNKPGHRPEFDQYAWWPLEKVAAEVVPFKQNVYQIVRSQFEPIILKCLDP